MEPFEFSDGLNYLLDAAAAEKAVPSNSQLAARFQRGAFIDLRERGLRRVADRHLVANARSG
jgi:hypothetical protein